jgi:hypothetical protein
MWRRMVCYKCTKGNLHDGDHSCRIFAKLAEKKIITRIRVPNDGVPTPHTGAHWPCFAKEMWSPFRSSLEMFWTVPIPRTRYKIETVGTPLQWTSSFLPETMCYRPLWTPPWILRTARYTDLSTLTLWPWSRTFKFQHTIYVKCEYLWTKKR